MSSAVVQAWTCRTTHCFAADSESQVTPTAPRLSQPPAIGLLIQCHFRVSTVLKFDFNFKRTPLNLELAWYSLSVSQ